MASEGVRRPRDGRLAMIIGSEEHRAFTERRRELTKLPKATLLRMVRDQGVLIYPTPRELTKEELVKELCPFPVAPVVSRRASVTITATPALDDNGMSTFTPPHLEIGSSVTVESEDPHLYISVEVTEANTATRAEKIAARVLAETGWKLGECGPEWRPARGAVPFSHAVSTDGVAWWRGVPFTGGREALGSTPIPPPSRPPVEGPGDAPPRPLSAAQYERLVRLFAGAGIASTTDMRFLYAGRRVGRPLHSLFELNSVEARDVIDELLVEFYLLSGEPKESEAGAP